MRKGILPQLETIDCDLALLRPAQGTEANPPRFDMSMCSKFKSLKKLSLKLDAAMFRKLGESLALKCNSLETLELTLKGSVCRADDELCEHILSCCPNLKHYHFECKLADDGYTFEHLVGHSDGLVSIETNTLRLFSSSASYVFGVRFPSLISLTIDRWKNTDYFEAAQIGALSCAESSRIETRS